jgi:dienelactone hydrolase
MLERTKYNLGWMCLSFLLAFSAKPTRDLTAQSASPYVSALTAKAGIVQEPFPHLRGTAPLTLPSDIPLPKEWASPRRGAIYAVQLAQEQEYWLQQIAATPPLRDKFWRPDFSSVDAYRRSLQGHRESLRKMLGLIDLGSKKPEVKSEALESDGVRVEDVTLAFEEDFLARALVFIPQGKAAGAVIALPDAAESREAFAGVAEGGAPAKWLTSLLERRLVVCVPVTIERENDYPFGLLHHIDRRQLLYRLGFIVGRTLVGLEVQQTLALDTYLVSRFLLSTQQVAVLGEGQGGMAALYAGAVDGGFGGAAVVNYFQQRERCWEEPVDRMLYGQLNEFGDAEIAALVAPQPLAVIHTAGGPTPPARVQAELARAKRFYAGLGKPEELSASEEPEGEALTAAASQVATRLGATQNGTTPKITLRVSKVDIEKARDEQFEAIHTYLRRVDAASDATRESHWKLRLTPPSGCGQRVDALRRELTQLMGVVPPGNGPLHPRTRLLQVTEKFIAYDVLLDVLPGVEAYGQLLIPRHLPGRLPVVICQHGLGDEPARIIGLEVAPLELEPTIYHSLGSRLAGLGYVVFAPYVAFPQPQELLVNPLVRQAAALGKMRTSLELAKLHRIIDFLQSLPQVDPQRIGYYGLSYGGYSAIWMPPLEPRIKADVISGHFNDWRTKITYEEHEAGYQTSYLKYQDADFYNWNVLNRFTHVELIAAQWPRPVCVEFGERDTTTTPEWHTRAWQEVTAFSHAWRLDGLEARIVRVHFDGVHEIHGIGTFAFLNRWLQPQQPDGRDYTYMPVERQTPGPSDGLADTSAATLPYLTHDLDSSQEARVAGRFHVSPESPIFEGLAIKMSRVGVPGDVIFCFGSKDGASDIGEARIPAQDIHPVFDLMYKAQIKPVRLDPSKLYFFEVRALSGKAPLDYYLVYGPKPLGGNDYSPDFGLSFEVLGTTRSANPIQVEQRFEFVRRLLDPYTGGLPVITRGARPPGPDEISINNRWSIRTDMAGDEVLEAAAADLSQFFRSALKVDVNTSRNAAGPHIDLRVMPSGVAGVTAIEGYRVDVGKTEIEIRALSSRGVMRGIYALEDLFRVRKGPFLKTASLIRNCRFPRRITRAVGVTGIHRGDTSRPSVYTDGVLQRISHSGFNGLWVWVNTEEVTLESQIFPELNDPEAAIRLARLEDLARRARRYGIDIYVYFATGGYHRHLPESFFEKHPETRGYGWGPPMCTSTESVRRYYTETVGTLFHHAPLVRGLIVIYDSEGFWYCGNSQRSLEQCPRCRHRTQQEVAAELLTTLDDAVHTLGGSDKDLIAENYNMESQWVLKLLPMLPKDIIIQADFNKGMVMEKDGIRHQTEDYIISQVGPPELFVNEYKEGRADRLRITTKTENSVSQEFIFVPYIPCMEQWYHRIAKIRAYDLDGWFGNWFFCGFTSSRTEELINRMSFDPAPSMEDLLRQQAAHDFGQEAVPYVLRAWHDFSEGIRAYPYSDGVARYPGPLQRGPSNPFFVNPAIRNFGQARAWQNDLEWSNPWGPEITAKYLGQVEDWFLKGDAELEAARHVAPREYQPAIDSELRIGRTIQSAVRSTLHLIEWLRTRDAYNAAKSDKERWEALETMDEVAIAELENARLILPLLERDSRLGYASDGAGLIRGGLFNPDLVRWKIGEIEDLLLRVLPALPPGKPKD